MNIRQYHYFNTRITYVIVKALRILISIVGCSSKETLNEDNRIPESNHTGCPKITLNKSILFMISDGSSESPTQIIQYSDTIIRHGFAYVTYPFDRIVSRDIVWIKKLDINGVSFPMVERVLTDDEISIINRIISNIEQIKDNGSYIVRDDYQYIVYLDKKKFLTVSPAVFNIRSTPHELNEIIDSIISISGQLYPNFGFMIDGS